MGSDDGVPPQRRMTNRDRPVTGQGASHSFQANLANRLIRPGKSVKAMVSLFEGPSPSASVKGDEVGRTSPESLSSALRAESSFAQHSGKKKEKALSASSNDAANQQLSLLLGQLDRFGVEEDGRNLNPAAPSQEQEVEPEKAERRDPEEVKKFWGNVRAQLWIEDDELDDPPALDEGGETSHTASEGIPPSNSSTVVGSKTPRKMTEPVAPPDTSFCPDSPFGTGPVLESLKEYYNNKESEPAQTDPSPTAVRLPGGMTFDNRVADPSLVPRPLRTPSRGNFGTSPTLPSTGSGVSFTLSSPTPAARSRTHPPQGQLDSSPPTMSREAIDDILTQFPAVARQYPHRPAQQMGSSPPTMAPSSDCHSEDAESVYSQDEQQFGSSPPPPPIPARSPLRPLSQDVVSSPTGAGRQGHQQAPSSHLSIDQYYYLFKEPEGHGGPSSQTTARLPRSNTQPIVGSQDRGPTESISTRRHRQTRFPRIDTSLANSSNPRIYNLAAQSNRRFDLLEEENEEEDEDDLDTPMQLPRLPQGNSASANTSARSSIIDDTSSHGGRTGENRVTRWPTVAPLRLQNRNPSSSSSGLASASQSQSLSRSSSTATLAPALPITRRAQVTTLPGSMTTGNLGGSSASPAGSLAQRRRGHHHRRGMTMNLSGTPGTSTSSAATGGGSNSSNGTNTSNFAPTPGQLAHGSDSKSKSNSNSTPSTPYYGPPPLPAPSYPPPSIPLPHSRGGSGDSGAGAASGTKTPQEKIVELDEFFANLDLGSYVSSRLARYQS